MVAKLLIIGSIFFIIWALFKLANWFDRPKYVTGSKEKFDQLKEALKVASVTTETLTKEAEAEKTQAIKTAEEADKVAKQTTQLSEKLNNLK